MFISHGINQGSVDGYGEILGDLSSFKMHENQPPSVKSVSVGVNVRNYIACENHLLGRQIQYRTSM